MKINNSEIGLKKDHPAKIFRSKHPVLAHKLTKLREKKTDSNTFRHILREVTFYLGYEATHDLSLKPRSIETPLAIHEAAEIASAVCIVPIMRAGLGMVDPMLDLLPLANVHHIGMYRSNESLLPVQYFNKLPKKCDSDVAIVLEPMIATAGTIKATVSLLKSWGVPVIKIVTVIASKDGLKDLCSVHPNVEIFVAAIDETLTESGLILPGLGDAGDRQFATLKQSSDLPPQKRPRQE